MKINKYIIQFLTLCFFAIGTIGCTNGYDDVNKPFGEIDDKEGERDGYNLGSAMNGMMGYVISIETNRNQFIECLMAGSYGGYLADSNPGFNGKNYASYSAEEHWIQVPFNDVISGTYNEHKKVLEATEDEAILAVANIVKVMSLARMADLYGPIPYTQLGGGKLVAPYDSQEKAYDAMIADLDASINTLTRLQTADFIGSADDVYSGVVLKWLKLANSMKLRMALRISNVSSAKAKKIAEEVIQHSVGPIVSNDDNAQKGVPNTNPFRVVMYEYNGGDSRVSADITSYMNGYNDPRCEKYFTLSEFATPGYDGLRSGILIPSGDDAHKYSNMVVDLKTPLVWFNAAEVAFLRAEGAIRGWNMGGTAEQFYNDGIKLSFEQWGASGSDQYQADGSSIPQSYRDPRGVDSYKEGISSTITVKWAETSTLEQKIERVITQKWIANFPLGMEAWSEYRRTGYPKLMVVKRNNSGGKVQTARMARRLPYPQEERTDNKINYEIAIRDYLKGADDQGTDVWWAKKD